MKIGVVKEIKQGEGRVALTPEGIKKILSSSKNNHEIYVETQAGIISGFSDEEYRDAGAKILDDAEKVWKNATLIVHVKEPLKDEYQYIRPDHILFTYFHLAAEPELTKELMNRNCIAIAYETLEDRNGELPLLKPMSAVAGKMAFVYSLYSQQANVGGQGIYLGEIFKHTTSKILIVGGGIVGMNAADSFIGIGSDLIICEKNPEKRIMLQKKYPHAKVITDLELRDYLYDVDVVVGAILIHGAKAPKIITSEDMKKMKKGALIVDISIDQGGITDVSKPTSICDPSYEYEDIILCCIPNIPGTVPRTSTILLTRATLPFVIELADKGETILNNSREFQTALNIYKGRCTNENVAKACNVKYSPLKNTFS